MKKRTTFLLSFFVLTLIVSIGISYAYFTAQFTGGETTDTITVTGGKMNIVYDGGPNINIANIIPSNNPAAIKTFTVTGNNTTPLDMGYQLTLIIEENNFTADALKYRLISTNTGNNGEVVPSKELTIIGTGPKEIKLGTATFDSPTNGNKIHIYSLEIYFPESNVNQNINQGKEFKAYINIMNYNDPCKNGDCIKDKIIAEAGETKEAIESKGFPDFSVAIPAISSYDNSFDINQENNRNPNTSYHFTYADSFTFDNATGKYTLVNPVYGRYSEIYPNLTGKYIVDYIGTSQAKLATYQNVGGVYIILGTTATSFTYKSSGLVENYSNVGSGIYATEDEYGTSYYFRGNKTYLNNNLIWGGFQWKIIRINGDGSLRLLYNGTEQEFNTNGTMNSFGESTIISKNPWNLTNYNDAKYLGYMYGGPNGENSTSRELAVTNETSSNIKTVLEAWYQNNIAGKPFESQVVDNLFCNDRQLQSEVGGDATGPGYGISDPITTTYASYYRLRNSTPIMPSLRCNQKNDRFTANDTELGNGMLQYPVGTITADEILFSGFTYTNNSSGNYLFTKEAYWTMSPGLKVYNSEASPIYMHNSAFLGYVKVSNSLGIRPVISITSDTPVTGTGTMSNPYRAI